jgi:hypothetical protein
LHRWFVAASLVARRILVSCCTLSLVASFCVVGRRCRLSLTVVARRRERYRSSRSFQCRQAARAVARRILSSLHVVARRCTLSCRRCNAVVVALTNVADRSPNPTFFY